MRYSLKVHFGLVEVLVEPQSQADQEKLDTALSALTADDHSFRARQDRSMGVTSLSGQSWLHLETKLDLLKRKYGIEMKVGRPSVVYLETISKRVEVIYTHKKSASGRSEFARLKLVAEPNGAGAGNVLETEIADEVVPARFLPDIVRGLESATAAGLLMGMPVVDLKISLLDGAYHAQDSSPSAFETAACDALRQLIVAADPILLQPIMKVEIKTPLDHGKAITADITKREGLIEIRQPTGEGLTLIAKMPLAKLLDYGAGLHSLSEDRATFRMTFDHYAPASRPTGDPPFRPAAALRA